MQSGCGSRDERQNKIEFGRNRENVHLLGGCLVVDAFIYRIALQALVARRAPIASQLQPLTLEPAISIREIKEPRKMGIMRSKRPTKRRCHRPHKTHLCTNESYSLTNTTDSKDIYVVSTDSTGQVDG